jgi:hypothetical protein
MKRFFLELKKSDGMVISRSKSIRHLIGRPEIRSQSKQAFCQQNEMNSQG